MRSYSISSRPRSSQGVSALSSHAILRMTIPQGMPYYSTLTAHPPPHSHKHMHMHTYGPPISVATCFPFR